MSRIALVRNPASTRNRANGVEPVPPGVRLIQPPDLDGLTAALEAAHAGGAEIVAVDGGDGTVRDVLSRAPEVWGGTPPRIAIVAHGNTNLIAREVGGLASCAQLTEMLRRLKAGEPLTERRHAMLRLDWTEFRRPPVRGSIIGWGAYVEGTSLARERIGARGATQVALTAASMLFQVLAGGSDTALRRGIDADVKIDDEMRPAGRRFLGIATSLQRPLAAGINPFWGSGPGAIRWLDIMAPPSRLALAAPALMRGRPARWMHDAGYASGRAARVEIGLDTPVVMDGEFYPPGERLVLTADEDAVFASL